VRAGRLTVADVLACMVCDERGVDRWLEQSPGGMALWRISLEAPRSVLGGVNALMSPVLFERVRLLSPGEWLKQGAMESEIYQALLTAVGRSITARLSSVMAVAAMVSGDADEGLRYAREAAAVNAGDVFLVQFAEALELEGRRRIVIGDYKGAVRCYENMLSLGKESPQAHYGMGHCMRAVGDMQNAYIHFARAVVGAPAQIHYRTELAEVALSIGQFETADRQYQKILELEPENARAMLLYARALVYRGREDRNPERAVELATRACEVTRWEMREAITGLADIYIEAGRVLEGMGLKRRLKEGGVLRVNGERRGG
jgi:tetratricopeptide (TPR) repeat protein